MDVFIGSSIAHVKQEDAHESWFSKIRSRLANRQEHTRSEETSKRWIPSTPPWTCRTTTRSRRSGPGNFFGEMTCMSFHPRSATAWAKTKVIVLEMLRNVLDILQKNKTFRAELDRKYRQRALETHLKSVPTFASMPSDFIAYLRDRVELLRYSAGEVIVRQGDVADAFYLVRLGFVKISEHRAGGDLVLTYTGRGGYFGEMGLLGGGVRTATCTALDHVDAVRIKGEDFALMLQRFDIRANLEQVAAERAAMNLQRARSAR